MLSTLSSALPLTSSSALPLTSSSALPLTSSSALPSGAPSSVPPSVPSENSVIEQLSRRKFRESRQAENVSPEETLLYRKFHEGRFEFQHILDSMNWFTEIGLKECIEAWTFLMSHDRYAKLLVTKIIPPEYEFEGRMVPLSPLTALNEERTYTVAIVVKVVVYAMTGFVMSDSTEFTLMNLPILMYSTHCHDRWVLVENPHPLDPGTSAIINGKDYVVLLYEKARINIFLLRIDKDTTKLPYISHLSETPMRTSNTTIYLVSEVLGSLLVEIKVKRYFSGAHRLNESKAKKESGEEQQRFNKSKAQKEQMFSILSLCYALFKKSVITLTHVNQFGAKSPLLKMFYGLGMQAESQITQDLMIEYFRQCIRNILPREQLYNCLALLAATEQKFKMTSEETMQKQLSEKLKVKSGENASDVNTAYFDSYLFPLLRLYSDKVDMIITMTARLLQCKAGYVPLTDMSSWQGRGLFLVGSIYAEILSRKMLKLHEIVTEEKKDAFLAAENAGGIQSLIKAVNIENKFMSELRALKPKQSAKSKMTAKSAYDEKNALMLIETCSTNDKRAALTKHRNNASNNSSSMRQRSTEANSFPVMDVVKVTEGKTCGSVKFISQHTYVTLNRDPKLIADALLKYQSNPNPNPNSNPNSGQGQGQGQGQELAIVPSPSPPVMVLYHGGDYTVPVFINGSLVGYTTVYGYVNITVMKRFGLIDRKCCVTYLKSTGCVEIFCDAHRLVFPVLVCARNPTTRATSPSLFQDPNWRLLTFDGMVRRGYIEWMDIREVDNPGTRIAEMFMSFGNHQADIEFLQFQAQIARDTNNQVYMANVAHQLEIMDVYWPTKMVLHPMLCYSLTCGNVEFFNALMSCRAAFSEKMENHKMGEFLDDPSAHVSHVSPMFHTKSRVTSRLSELAGIRDRPVGKTVTFGLTMEYVNQEDAFIMSKAVSELGKFHYMNTTVITEVLEANEKFGVAIAGGENPHYWRHINPENGTPSILSYFEGDDIIIGKYEERRETVGGNIVLYRINRSRVLLPTEYGYVIDVITYRTSTSGGMVSGQLAMSVLMRKANTPEIGDKDATSEPQKHILAAKPAAEDMTHVVETGEPVSVKMNPQCVSTRMTKGTPLRPLLGTSSGLTGKTYDTHGHNYINTATMMADLRDAGFSDKGLKRVRNGITGEVKINRILVGPSRLSPLVRIGEKQLQCRGLGKNTKTTGQPESNKSDDKGQKHGHYEGILCAMYGAGGIAYDKISKCCDGITIVVCRYCSSYAVYDPIEKKFDCKMCDTVSNGSGKDQFGVFDMSRTVIYLSICLQSIGRKIKANFVDETEYLTGVPATKTVGTAIDYNRTMEDVMDETLS